MIFNIKDTKGSGSGGDAQTLGGHGAEYFAPKADLAYYIEADGSNGWVNSVADLNTFYTGITLTNSSENMPDDDWWLVLAGGASGTTVQLAYNLWASRVPRIRYCAAEVWSEWYDLNKEYLPLTGGKMNQGQSIRYQLANNGGLSAIGSWFENIDGSDAGGICAIGHNGVFEGLYMAVSPYHYDTSQGLFVTANNIQWKNNDVLHTGNSAKVHIGTSAPSDTNALWIDTSA